MYGEDSSMIDSAQLAPALRISMDLAAVRRGKRFPWGRISRLLDEVETTEFWKTESAGSFTEWLRENSAAFGVKEGTLWRYLTAGRYYGQLREQYRLFFGGQAPSIELIDPSVSPENIELVSKLARVVPQDIFRPLVRNVLTGRIRRSDLRSLWETFRPVLDGRTARGRGVKPPSIDIDNPWQQESLSEAVALNVLLTAGPAWTGVREPKNYSIFPDVNLNEQEQKIRFDAVAVMRCDENSRVLFHGIEVASKVDRELIRTFGSIFEYCDYSWVVHCDPKNAAKSRDIPEHVGVMVAFTQEIKVLRIAQTSEKAGEKSGDMAKALLLLKM